MTQTEIHLRQTTTSAPEQFIAGLTDFGPGRSKLFGNSADDYLKVHHRGRSEADVTEGSGGIWERLHYDWSDPNRVILKTTDSNVWGGAAGHTYTFTRQPNGTTDIDVVVVREGKNLKGRVLGFVLRTIGRSVLETAFENSVKAIEARNGAARERAVGRQLPLKFGADLTLRKPLSACAGSAQSKGTKKDKNVIESTLVGGEPLHQRRASVVTLLLASDRAANKESSGRLIAGEERTNNGSF